MSAVGELVLRVYDGLVSSGHPSRADSSEAYHLWQYQTSPAMFSSFPDFDLTGKRVLDLGSGLGGRTAWLAEHGAREVVGIDINGPELNEARRITQELHPNIRNVTFQQCSENEQLTSLGQFDVVLFLDSIEHVVSPLKALRLAGNYVKPGGRIYFTTIGWYHHAGAHMGIPFASLLFSDETILNYTRWKVTRPDYTPASWDSNPPLSRWEGVYDLRDRPGEYLNKITIKQLKRLVKYAPFSNGRVVVLGFCNSKLRWLNPLRHIPVINEVFHSAIVGVLQK